MWAPNPQAGCRAGVVNAISPSVLILATLGTAVPADWDRTDLCMKGNIDMTRHEHLTCMTFAAVLACLFAACTKPSTTVDRAKLKAFAPLPDLADPTTASATAQVELGRMLYYDARLSKG